MRILKEDTNITKEELPVSFLTDMISKGWEEVGYLREASNAIQETYRDTAQVEELMQGLMDAYLVFIGQIEAYLNKEESITPAVAADEISIEANVENQPETEKLPEAEVDMKPLKPIDSEVPAAVTGGHIASSGDFNEFAISDAELEKRRAPAEPFEFFVDFDEPDLSEPSLSDDDLYGYENPELEQNKLRAQIRG